MEHWVRAKGELRRYIRTWGLCFLWTLTYEVAATSWTAVVADLRRFFKRIQERYGRMPIAAVIERGRRGTKRLHAHFAVGQWLDHNLVAGLWHQGYVWVGDGGKMRGRVGCRALAGYLSKYLGKQMEAEANGDGDRPAGAHRYARTHVGTPATIRGRFLTVDSALAQLETYYGMPDAVCAFGIWDDDQAHGVWLSYPDELLHDPPPLE